jgi:hypothetical protein
MRVFLIVLLLFIAPTAFSADCIDSEQASRVFEKYLDNSYDDDEIEQLGDICRLYPYGEGNIRLAGFYHVKDSAQVLMVSMDICHEDSLMMKVVSTEPEAFSDFLDPGFVMAKFKELENAEAYHLYLCYPSSFRIGGSLLDGPPIPFWCISASDGNEYFFYKGRGIWYCEMANEVRRRYYKTHKQFIESVIEKRYQN